MPLTSRPQLRHLAGRLLSRFENLGDLRSVCLMLCPYRNLTTLTASMAALHEHWQVLNHVIFADPRLNFFRGYTVPRAGSRRDLDRLGSGPTSWTALCAFAGVA